MDVTPSVDSYDPVKDDPVATCVTSYDCDSTGKTMISYLNTRKPTKGEFESIERFWVTSEKIWEPYSDPFASDEREMNDAFPRKVSNLDCTVGRSSVLFESELVDPYAPNGDPELVGATSGDIMMVERSNGDRFTEQDKL